MIEESEFDKVLRMLVDKEDEWEARQSVAVTHMDLKPMYMKIQKKTTFGSEQRIEHGIVHFTVNAYVQIAKVRAFVERSSDWFEEKVLGDSGKERSELKTKVIGQQMTDYQYIVDLDSVYRTDEGKKVYALKKNKGEDRNNWILFITVELIDQTTKDFFFGPFLVKTKPAKRQR